MKTSKIIFISFFGVIGLFLLSLLIQVPNGKRDVNFETETEALPHFSHLVVTKRANLQVTFGATDSIKLSHNKGIIITKPVYWTKGDTLIVDPIPNQEHFFVELTCSDLKSISLTESRVVLTQISLGNLKIESENAEVSIFNKVTIDSLSMKLNNKARFYCYDSEIKLVDLTLRKSNAEFNIDQIVDLKAELRDSSELSTWKVLRSDVQTDETSRYYSR